MSKELKKDIRNSESQDGSWVTYQNDILNVMIKTHNPLSPRKFVELLAVRQCNCTCFWKQCWKFYGSANKQTNKQKHAQFQFRVQCPLKFSANHSGKGMHYNCIRINGTHLFPLYNIMNNTILHTVLGAIEIIKYLP